MKILDHRRPRSRTAELQSTWPGRSRCSSAMKATACRETWLHMADGAVTIPCPGPVESLNAAVAASVLLYEASPRSEGSLLDEPL